MATLTGKIVADFTTALASEIAIGGTSATLASATDDDGVSLPAGRYFFTIDGSNSRKEHISCDLSSTALTNIKSVSRQGVETTGVARKHRIGASVTITDFAHILQINNLVNGTTDLDSSDPLKYDGTATINNDAHLATKKYVDDTAVSGAPDATTTAKGIVELATQAEVDAKTATGGTGASLVSTPALQRSTLLSDYKADTGSANAYVITPTPAITAYTVGQIFSFKANNANTGASTLNVNALGTKTIKKGSGATDLANGDIAAGQVVLVEYDGTNFQMLNQVGSIVPDFYGTGTDGDVTISSNTTLTRDMFYNNLTINSGVTLNAAGYRIFVKSTLTNNNATNGITNNGGNASGITGGTGAAAGTLGGGGAGAGGTNITSTSGGGGGGGGAVVIYAKNVAVQGGIQALGGNGGNAVSSSYSGTNPGSNGTSSNPTLITSGTGGNGGTGGTSGGGGGTGGTVTTSAMSPTYLAISRTYFDFVTALTLKGGAGGASGGGSSAGTGVGGGGGGQGGVIIFVYNTIITSGTLSVAGGTGGTGAGTNFTNGSNGSSGLTLSLQY